jgi:hypothetical protein
MEAHSFLNTNACTKRLFAESDFLTSTFDFT